MCLGRVVVEGGGVRTTHGSAVFVCRNWTSKEETRVCSHCLSLVVVVVVVAALAVAVAVAAAAGVVAAAVVAALSKLLLAPPLTGVANKHLR